MPVFIGTSGWQYRHWRDAFYPQGLPQKAWLEFYAERFQVVELNNSFYHLPKPEFFAAWAQRTPADFIIAAKVSRYLTHIKRLQDPAEPVARFMENASRLGSKLGPLLLQLPPNLQVDLPALDETLSRFPEGVRVAVEFRHPSWFTPATKSLLEDHGAACCLADRNGTPVTSIWRTTDWSFVRWHHGLSRPPPCYRRKDMTEWAQRIAGLWEPREDVYAFFNNDPRGCALRDACVFAQEAEVEGLRPTRVPARKEVKIV
ncbi:MAG: hypothetical protein QOH48_2086 [Actinomycetota bacterium]|jgi:uncharacterized protein YecE (DUF72 family)|nr:hypothetical protein [Actinomycetota bacterium]